jgi:hypothetical protein
MFNVLIAGLLLSAVGTTSATKSLTTAVVGTSQASAEGKPEDKPIVGRLARVNSGDAARDKDMNGRLHFCVFDNGTSDSIYVGTQYGMWSHGQFDLTVDGKAVFTGQVDNLLYGGIVIQMGDVLTEKKSIPTSVSITKVTGIFK